MLSFKPDCSVHVVCMSLLLSVNCSSWCRGTTTCEPRHDKTNNVAVRPAETQISLGIRPFWSESSLCAHWVDKDTRFLHADSEDSDQTGRMPRLIWVFAGHTLILLVLSCRGSCYFRIPRSSLLIFIRVFVYTFYAMINQQDKEMTNKETSKKCLNQRSQASFGTRRTRTAPGGRARH